MSEPSRVAKRKLLQLLVHEMGQTCKVVLDPLLLGPADEHCIPDFILQQFAHGVPLDLNPRYPLELDIDSDLTTEELNFESEDEDYEDD